MEKNEHIIIYLNEYISMSDPQYAVLLKGKWGCGKTFIPNVTLIHLLDGDIP